MESFAHIAKKKKKKKKLIKKSFWIDSETENDLSTKSAY